MALSAHAGTVSKVRLLGEKEGCTLRGVVLVPGRTAEQSKSGIGQASKPAEEQRWALRGIRVAGRPCGLI